MQLFGCILAGGQARRMGGHDKALLPFAGAPLIASVIARFAPQVAALAISANGAPSRFADFGLPVLPDDDESRGPLSGVLAALRWAGAKGATALVTVPVDCPFLPGDLAPRLLLAGPLAYAGSGGRVHPACAVWPVSLEPVLAAFLASGAKPRVMDFLARQGAAEAVFADDGAFANLNTPADLAAAEARRA
ncbi:MAG: molybdenum cofactor guanylyltransferase [Rhodobacteraceae bacterium]|nr:molybdenum cofactor guanylyltransferase [Paracoccaceae bacterium]